jgi:hypothetical protein
MSAITRQPRLATNPANALLNYLYSILETEAIIAARTMGLDPGLGVFHVDSAYRESLASDLMEPVRGEIDAYLLELLVKRSFGARDFHETQQGVCRLTPALAKELWATAPHWGRLVGRVAEDLARRLLEPIGHSVPRIITVPHGKPAKGVPRPKAGTVKLRTVPRRCSVCGGTIEDRPRDARTCSDECAMTSRRENSEVGAKQGGRARADMKARGISGSPSPDARGRMASIQVERRREQREWDHAHPGKADPDVYWREVYPLVRELRAVQIAELTGLASGHAQWIKRGKVVPHRRWWEALVRSFAVRRPEPAS